MDKETIIYLDGFAEGLNMTNNSTNKMLDKIRAEIEQLPTKKCTETHMVYIDAYNFKKNVLAIIDKYKAESEEVEDADSN